MDIRFKNEINGFLNNPKMNPTHKQDIDNYENQNSIIGNENNQENLIKYCKKQLTIVSFCINSNDFVKILTNW